MFSALSNQHLNLKIYVQKLFNEKYVDRIYKYTQLKDHFDKFNNSYQTRARTIRKSNPTQNSKPNTYNISSKSNNLVNRKRYNHNYYKTKKKSKSLHTSNIMIK